MQNIKTESELLFERFCLEHSVRFEPIPTGGDIGDVHDFMTIYLQHSSAC